MKKADLEAIGLTAETIEKAGLEPDVLEKILTIHSKDIEKWKGLDAENATLKTQLEETGKTIEGFKGLKTQAEVDAAVAEYKTAAEKAKTDAEAQVAEIKFNTALEKELKENAGARDPADIIPHLKRDLIQLGEDGKFIGLAEQVNPLIDSKPYLFADTEVQPEIIAGGHSHSVLSDGLVDSARKAAGLPVNGE
jgi:hypothetical protein